MSDQYQPDPPESPGRPERVERPEASAPPRIKAGPPLPEWLAKTALYPDEKPEWVRGPRYAPPWERMMTHPLAFLAAIPPAAICLAVGRIIAGEWKLLHPAFGIAAILIVFGSIIVIGFLTAYYTRLVVTDRRLLIIQGQVPIRSWGLGDLPASLLHFGRHAFGGKDAGPRIDLNKLEKMLGGGGDGVVSSDAIIKFGKQLDRIKERPDGA